MKSFDRVNIDMIRSIGKPLFDPVASVRVDIKSTTVLDHHVKCQATERDIRNKSRASLLEGEEQVACMEQNVIS
jgi:ATP-dependent helicase YprA (DUF1998 family)